MKIRLLSTHYNFLDSKTQANWLAWKNKSIFKMPRTVDQRLYINRMTTQDFEDGNHSIKVKKLKQILRLLTIYLNSESWKEKPRKRDKTRLHVLRSCKYFLRALRRYPVGNTWVTIHAEIQGGEKKSILIAIAGSISCDHLLLVMILAILSWCSNPLT